MGASVPALLTGLLLAVHTGAFAAQRTFVASNGSDANACSLVAPCRSFSRALTVTDDRGEIIVLDSAGYGVVSINQSVSIIAPPGVYAGISVLGSSNGIYINSGDVTLRGLTINGQNSASLDGIFVFDAGSVHIENCVVSNMVGMGIRIAPGIGKPTVHVSHSVIRSNGSVGIMIAGGVNSNLFVDDTLVTGNVDEGILIQAGFATIDQVISESNSYGVSIIPAAVLAQALIRDSVLGRSGFDGLFIFAGAGAQAVAACERCSSAGNGRIGFSTIAGPGGIARLTLGESLASGNSSDGVRAFGAVVFVTGTASTQNAGYGFITNTAGLILSGGNNFARANGAGNQAGSVINVGTI